MNVHPKIAIIGSGVMGEAIISGLIRNDVTLPANIRVSDTRQERVDELHSIYAISPFTDNVAAVSQADVVVVSVKPQRLDLVMSGLKDKIPGEALVLSIIAGATIDKISNGLNHHCVVRSMPNTPAQIGEGITVWVASPMVSPEQLELARRILTALGQEVYAEEENFLDKATALSGTGPAYVFLFMEALIDAGVHLGFSRRIAEQLVVQTLRGSVDYYQKRMDHPAALRNEVTSPGGTSAEALYYLEKAGFRTAISRAIWAAYERSKELGQGKEAQVPDKKAE
jgi:pyrroline-5-carboxylate reductase